MLSQAIKRESVTFSTTPFLEHTSRLRSPPHNASPPPTPLPWKHCISTRDLYSWRPLATCTLSLTATGGRASRHFSCSIDACQGFFLFPLLPREARLWWLRLRWSSVWSGHRNLQVNIPSYFWRFHIMTSQTLLQGGESYNKSIPPLEIWREKYRSLMTAQKTTFKFPTTVFIGTELSHHTSSKFQQLCNDV